MAEVGSYEGAEMADNLDPASVGVKVAVAVSVASVPPLLAEDGGRR